MFQKCPICHERANVRTAQNYDAKSVECDFCGKYFAEHNIDRDISEQMPNVRHLLAGYMFHSRTEKRPVITIDDAASIVSNISEQDPLQKLDLCLMMIRRSLDRPDQMFSQNSITRQVIYARDATEIESLLEFALDLDLISEARPRTIGRSAEYTISAKGWEYLRSLSSSSQNSSSAFVAMDFRPELTPVFDKGFAPALNATGWNPVRADRIEHASSIDDLVISQIRSAGLMVADFTYQNQGVYFEAGFAFGIGIQVIWTCKFDHLDKVNFDTRQYNHLIWEDITDLEEKLANRVRAMDLSR